MKLCGIIKDIYYFLTVCFNFFYLINMRFSPELDNILLKDWCKSL